MKPHRTWKFPLVVLAVSARAVGFVAATGPMRIDAVRSWSVRHVTATLRERVLKSRVLGAIEKFNPETILLTQGSRWRMSERWRESAERAAHQLGLSPAFVDLDEACASLGCRRTLRAAAERVIAWHPELERRLRPAIGTRRDTSGLRDLRPVLSALTAMHAASVRHVIKFG
jgi:hypothetical protein